MSHERGLSFLRDLPRLTRDIPFSPRLLGSIAAELGNPEADFSRAAALLSTDQGLTARLLKLANSAYYGLEAKVASVQRALVVLGLTEVRVMVLALAAGALFRGGKASAAFDLESYWTHQVRVALTARSLAGNRRGVSPDTLYTAGMLHDLGKLLTATHAPEDYAAVAAIAAEQGVCWSRAEELHWGLDHGVIAALVLGSWSLPEALVEPVNWHHSPEASPGDVESSALLALADALVNGLDSPEAPAPADVAALAAALGLDMDDIESRARSIMDDETTLTYARDLAAFAAA